MGMESGTEGVPHVQERNASAAELDQAHAGPPSRCICNNLRSRQHKKLR